MIISKRIVTKNNEIFIIRDNESNFCYAPLRKTMLKITEEALANLENKPEETIANLETILKSRPTISFPEIEEFSDKNPYQPVHGSLALNTTCNLECLYCHADANYRKETMKWETAKTAIDFLIENCIKTQSKIMGVSFNGGGEPTQSPELFKRVVNYANEKANDLGIKVEYNMATNGVFDDEMASFIANNFKEVSFSIDGPEKIHNHQRPKKGKNKDSFSKAIRSAKIISQKIPVGLRATITQESFEEIEDIIKFFRVEFPNTPYALIPMFELGRGEETILNRVNERELTDYILNNEVYGENGKSKNETYYLGSILEVKKTFCSAYSGPGFNVNANGEILACQRDRALEKFSFGRITDGEVELNYDKMNEIIIPRIDSDQECNECFAKYNCGGDCMDLVTSEITRCDYMKESIVKELRKNLGGK